MMLQPKRMQSWLGGYPMPRPGMMADDRMPEDQPTLVGEPPVAQPQPQLRSVLDGKREQEQGSEENIRRMIERMKGYHKPGMPF